MRIGSLFSGIGGLELGLEWAGVGHTVWQVERDPYCQRVLARHWPDALRFDDVCTVGAHNLPPVDVICGGFPCQDISDAGKRAGIGGARSGLWFEFARIIRELRPAYVVVENVRALLVRGLDRVLGELAGAGYDAEWDVLSAKDVGALHLRKRVFLIACRADADSRGLRADGKTEERASYPDELRADVPNSDSGRAYEEPQRKCGGGGTTDTCGDGAPQSLADTNGRRREQRYAGERSVSEPDASGGVAVTDDQGSQGLRRERPDAGWDSSDGYSGQSRVGVGPRGKWWSVEPDVGRVAHGVPSRVDRLRALGNAVVPQCAEVIGRRLMELVA